MSQMTYPGVYVREVPSGVRTIAGVSTSVTAFVGRARRGPINEAVTVTSFEEFVRTFGGLWTGSMLAYAVRDFFRLGGSTAVIVRVEQGGTAATLTLDSLALAASSPGTWGNDLTGATDLDVADAANPNLFNLTVTDTATGQTEAHRNVSIDQADPRRVDRVLEHASSLVRLAGGALPATTPVVTPAVTTPPTPPPHFTGGDDGGDVTAAEYADDSLIPLHHGLYALDSVDIVNLIVIPPYLKTNDDFDDIDGSVRDAAIDYARNRRAFVILDPPSGWTTTAAAVTGGTDPNFADSRNSAVFFPRILERDPERDGRLTTMGASGAVAGIFAATDATRGVWKAPAGLDAVLGGVADLSVALTEGDIGQLNPVAVNCLRAAPGLPRFVVWGSRTREGLDRLGSEWAYIPVRRTALFLEESLYRGLQWVVFELNDEPLWAQIRLNVGAFMNNLFRRGAFQGATPRDAYFVKCDRTTTTQNDINAGIVNILVGFAPLRPAEFVVLRLQQIAGQIAT